MTVDKQLLSRTLVHLSPQLLRKLSDYAKTPTERNGCYMIGYITALNDSGQLEYETYSYLLALCGRLSTSEEVQHALKEDLT